MKPNAQDEKIAEQITDTWISKPSKQGLKQIAEAIQKARAEERERCASEIDSWHVLEGEKEFRKQIAQAIRNLK